MLRETRRLEAAELGASHRAVEVRTPFLRIASHHGTRTTSDWGVVERAAPFVHRMTRPAVSIVLAGRGRFDEGGRRFEIREGDLVASDQRRLGTEAYAGERSHVLSIEWDPAVLGGRWTGAASALRLSPADRIRLTTAALELDGPSPERASADVVRVLRGAGLGIEPLVARDLVVPVSDEERRLAAVVSARLSDLRSHPAIEDVVDELGWGPRRVHRRLAATAERYGLVWDHWRSMLHHYRLVTALRLLSAPGATTELVARIAGFRASTALCHAFDLAGLPSPGTLARGSRGDVLAAWAEHAAPAARPAERSEARAAGAMR